MEREYLKKFRLIVFLFSVVSLLVTTKNIEAAERFLWPVPNYTNVYQAYSSGHRGIDISQGGIAGKSVVATKSGVVVGTKDTCSCGDPYTPCTCNGRQGNYVIIRHNDGGLSRYLHLQYGSISVRVGQSVKRGDQIGLVGSSGESYGYHLHFDLATGSDWNLNNRYNPMNESYDYVIEPLSISNVQITDVTPDSYKVSCNITGNVTRALFPTWPSADDSGNPIWHEGTISGNTASCTIRKSDHGNKNGNYFTHIYIYDATEKSCSMAAPTVIMGDEQKPVISDIKISEIKMDSYTVTCKVYDNGGVTSVKFPTWPSADDSGNPIWHEGTINGDTASCVIKKSDHGNKTGLYITHIYAYDLNGNSTSSGVPGVIIGDTEPPVIDNINISNVTEDSYTITCTVKDNNSNGSISVRFPTWPSADDSGVPIWHEGTVNGDIASCVIKKSDHGNKIGTYISHIYAYDAVGNEAQMAAPAVELGKKHEHEYVSKVKKSATCTEPGIMLYTCKDNDDSYEEEIPATGHQHTELRNVKEATYAQEGYTGDTYCADCGAKLSSGKSISKLMNYNITYHLNGGINNTKNPKTYTSEQNALTILDPTKEHYTFNGWYLSKTGNEKFVSGNTYNKDLDLYARWSPKTYKVTYNPNGGTLKGATVQSVTYGEKYGTLRSVEREGYTFLGWYTSLTGTTKVTENTICNGDIVLYAHWQKVEVPDAGDDKKDDTQGKDDSIGKDDKKDDSTGKDDTTNKDDEKEDQTPVEKPHVHEYMLTKTIKATCLKNGKYVYTCICGAEKSLVISNEGMEHRWIEVIDKKATTTEEGIKHEECTVCGSKRKEYTLIDKIPVPKGSILVDKKVTYKLVSTGKVEYVKNTTSATSVVVPNTVTIDGNIYKVTSIAVNAFKNNKKLKKVVIGSNVTSIGKEAFSGCTKLASVTLGKNVTTIGDKAFYKCTALAKLTIPAKVNKIGKQTFYGCKKLKSITIKTTKLTTRNVGTKAFQGIYAKATIKVPKQKLSAYKKMLNVRGVGKKAKVKK